MSMGDSAHFPCSATVVPLIRSPGSATLKRDAHQRRAQVGREQVGLAVDVERRKRANRRFGFETAVRTVIDFDARASVATLEGVRNGTEFRAENASLESAGNVQRRFDVNLEWRDGFLTLAGLDNSALGELDIVEPPVGLDFFPSWNDFACDDWNGIRPAVATDAKVSISSGGSD